MSIEFKAISRKSPQNMKAPLTYYAMKAAGGETTIDELCEHIEKISSLSKTSVYSVITALVETIPTHLAMGNTVRLGELGSIQINFKSLPSDKKRSFRKKYK